MVGAFSANSRVRPSSFMGVLLSGLVLKGGSPRAMRLSSKVRIALISSNFVPKINAKFEGDKLTTNFNNFALNVQEKTITNYLRHNCNNDIFNNFLNIIVILKFLLSCIRFSFWEPFFKCTCQIRLWLQVCTGFRIIEPWTFFSYFSVILLFTSIPAISF